MRPDCRMRVVLSFADGDYTGHDLCVQVTVGSREVRYADPATGQVEHISYPGFVLTRWSGPCRLDEHWVPYHPGARTYGCNERLVEAILHAARELPGAAMAAAVARIVGEAS